MIPGGRFLASEHVQRIVPYRPGWPEDLPRNLSTAADLCLLALNEIPHGASARALDGYGLLTYQRITVGSRAQNEQLLRAIDRVGVGHG